MPRDRRRHHRRASATRGWCALRRLAPQVELYGKLEAANPGGSVKDRIGVAMIEAAEREGRIEPGRTHDRRGDQRQHRDRAGDGLRGEGLRARAHAAAGDEPRAHRAAAPVRRPRRADRVDGRHDRGGRARARAGPRPDVFLPDQFSNPANPEVHRRTTGPEILAALDGRVDALVAGRRDRAARSPASARCCAPPTRAAASSPSSPSPRPCSAAARRARTASRASAPASCPRCSTAS